MTARPRPSPAGARILAAFADIGRSSLTMNDIEVRARISPPQSHAAVRKLIADGHLRMRTGHGGALYTRIQEGNPR
jgi:DNA-binding Lrp family transcriptional regulator